MSGSAEVTLVSMPFAHALSPSIGLSLLRAGLASRGIPCRVRHFSIRFAELLGRSCYDAVGGDGTAVEDLTGDWVFARALFGPRERDTAYVDEVLRRRLRWTTNEACPASETMIRRLRRARERADAFLAWCRDELVGARPRLVGFTSAFQQHVATLALARLVKQAAPDVTIVLGGANCEGVMGAETVRRFPFVDAAVSGEGDLVFPELVERVLAGRSLAGLAGVRTPQGVAAELASGRLSSAPMVRDMDALPFADYADFFEEFEASRFGREWTPSIPFETSRGCWWGERMHCTFCGLNGETMAYRSKSAGRAIAELEFLTRRHPGSEIGVTDTILDMGYFEDFLPRLAERRLGASLLYEVKSNLRRDQLRLLREAGVRGIQPGIESLSDPVLKLMRKGVSALQNVQLLKWCRELGIKPSWNLLWGFPGEPPEEYERMARLVPLLAHLAAPEDYGMIRLDRFSPNFDDAARLGFADVEPVPPYRYVYALPDEAISNLAYFFTFRFREPRDVAGYVARLESQLRTWRRRGVAYDLFFADLGECLLVWDLRPRRRALLSMLGGTERLLYLACDRACDLRRLAQIAAQEPEGPTPCEAVAERLRPLVESGLLLRDGSRYLALALPLGAGYSPAAQAVERLYRRAQALGRRVRGGWIVSPGVGAGRARRAGSRRQPRRRQAVRRATPRRLTAAQFSILSPSEVLVRSGRATAGYERRG